MSSKFTTTEKERLRALDNMPDGILYRSVRDARTGIMIFDYVSGTWEAVTGVKAEDAMADLRNVFVNIPPDDLQQLMQYINESDVRKKKFNIEVRYNHPVTKNEHWFQISSYPRIEGDNIIADGFIFDITSRKEAELKLRTEKERLESLGNNIPDGALYQFVLETLTGKMRMSFVSGKWEKITGVAAEVSMTSIDTLLAMVHPDDLPMVMQRMDDSAQTMTNYFIEFRFTVQGSTRWMQMSAKPHLEGLFIIWDGIIFDITARKHTEHELETERKRLQLLGDNIPGCTLYQFSKDLRTGQIHTLYVSATWEAVTGITAEDALADVSNVFDLIDEDDLPALIQSIDDSARNMIDHVFETRLGNRWINAIARPRREGLTIVWDGIITNITHRKETERQLEAEKKRMQMLGDNLPNCSLFQFVRDCRTRQMRLSYVSATWEAVTGIEAEDATTDVAKVFSLIHPEDFQLFLKSIDASAQTMNDFNLEIRLGSRWIHFVSRPRNEGALIVWDGIITDVTQRKHNDAELTKYREELELLVQERTDELNTSNEELYATNEELFATNEELHSKNTQIANEMNARMEVMKQLEDSENKMRNFIESSYEGIVIIDNDGRVVEWNPGQERIIGISRQDALGEYCWNLYKQVTPVENRDELVNDFRNSVLAYLEPVHTDKKRSDESEFFICTAGENERYLIVTSFQIRLADKYYLGQIVRDVTEHKLNEQELERYHTQLEQMVDIKTFELVRAKEKAEESDKLKSAFLANMSHEIRTPLNAIVGFLRFIDSEAISIERRRDYIKVINNSSKQLVKIIDDIIDISKIEAQQITLYPVSVNLNMMMNELRILYETYLQTNNKHHIELILDDSGFIDQCFICVDTVRLRQVFDNLISNAIKFTEKGFIRFGYRQSTPDLLEFVVEDSGIGLSSDQQEIIFERFRQAEMGNNRVYGGTGLGLAISRSLVQLMGGSIWVESIEGLGASFYFTVSYVPEEEGCETVQ